MTELIPRLTEVMNKKHGCRARILGYRIPQAQPASSVSADYMMADVELLENATNQTWESDPANPMRKFQTLLLKGARTTVRDTSLERLPAP